MSGKFIKIGERVKPHKCDIPFNWFYRRFPVGTIWECECGKRYEVIYSRMSNSIFWSKNR